MSGESQRILFVINKKSGAKNNIDWESLIRERFKLPGISISFMFMPCSDAASRLRQIMNELHPSRVVAVGGDGTVTLVASVLLGKEIPMGILPAGSANGMARELNIPADPAKAMDIVLTGTIKATDVLRINNERICLHLSDVGLNAQLIKYFEEGRIRGKFGYTLALIKALFRPRPMRVAVETKTELAERPAVMVLFANASKYGTGATINPDSSIFDGIFEVVIVKKLAVWQIVKMFFNPRRFNPAKIEVLGATSVTIETSHHAHFQVDGEYLGKVNKVVVKIISGQLQLIVPD
jgi:diacylglycerol kinase (ATP)